MEDAVAGDNRASFVNKRLGHQYHLLYLWHLADRMGVLKNVLNILSPAVSADGEHVNRNTQRVQRKRGCESDEQEKVERRAFRVAVGASLASLAVTSKEEALRNEEDKVERFTVAAMQAEEDGNERKRKYYERLAAHHENRVAEYIEEIAEMKKRAKTLASVNNKSQPK